MLSKRLKVSPNLEMFYGITSRGYLPFKLRMLAKLGKALDVNVDNEKGIRAIVGEVKGSKADFTECLGQLTGYLESGLYDGGICVVPEVVDRIEEARERGVGLLTWGSEGDPHFLPPPKIWGTSTCKSKRLKEIALDVVRALVYVAR